MTASGGQGEGFALSLDPHPPGGIIPPGPPGLAGGAAGRGAEGKMTASEGREEGLALSLDPRPPGGIIPLGPPGPEGGAARRKAAPSDATKRQVRFVVSCEHGGNAVPEAYRGVFNGADDILKSHRGWDAGALEVAGRLAEALGAPLHAMTTTRLLVDCNRSEGHKALFSEYSRALSRTEREAALDRIYRPHREAVRRAVNRGQADEDGRGTGGRNDAAAQGPAGRAPDGPRPVVHLACHSFTPVLDGRERRMDIGLLYDPKRPAERALCARWRETLKDAAPAWRVRRNAPYKGSADGLTAWLRRVVPTGYLGLEIEINQGLLARSPDMPGRVAETLYASLLAALAKTAAPSGGT